MMKELGKAAGLLLTGLAVAAFLLSLSFCSAEEAGSLASPTGSPEARGEDIRGVRVPVGFRAAPGTVVEPYTNTGWAKEVVHDKTGIEMVFIPAGEFMMGSPDYEASWDEGPVHGVRITKPFYLGKCELTQEQWERVMGSNPSRFKGSTKPVERVSWEDASEFCSRAGLRLPTEAEWEYASRAGTAAGYGFGDDESGLGFYAWYAANSGGRTHEVGTRKPNPWGLYDMHGNVWEWCQDWYGHYRRRSAGVFEDPGIPTPERLRVLRGGSWASNPVGCRSAYRCGFYTSYLSGHGGFRVARGLE